MSGYNTFIAKHVELRPPPISQAQRIEQDRRIAERVAKHETPPDDIVPGRAVAIVACSNRKLHHRAPAKHLYQGHLFTLCRRWCEVHGLDWLIVSAKHGIVHPDRELDPYDKRVPTRDDERRGWAQAVHCQTWQWAPAAHLILLCGADYRIPYDGSLGLEWEYPMEAPLQGLGIGEQMSHLKTEIHEVVEGRLLP